MCYRAPLAKKENKKEKVKHFLDLDKISSLHKFLKCDNGTTVGLDHLGPPIKWWEDIGYEGQRSNPSINTITKLENIYSKKFTYDALYMFRNIAEASFTKNMDVCMVEENEIMTNSQKRTTSVLVTVTQKKAKSKKSLVPNGLSLWLGFQGLNHINKQKRLPI